MALTVPLLKEMLKNPRVIGVKNSSMPVQDIQMWKDEGAIVFNGPDEQLLSGLAAGAVGGIGGTYAAMPELYLAIFRLFHEGKLEQGREIQNECCRIIYKMCSAAGNMYAVIKEIISQKGPALDSGQVASLVDQAFAERKLTEQGYVQEFRAMASDMIGYFLTQRADLTATAPVPLRFPIDAGEIVVTPDDVLVMKGGRQLFRRIQTGHYREDDVKEIDAGAFAIAVQQNAPGTQVQVLHLSDRETSDISFTDKSLKTKRKHLEEALSGVREGAFAPNVSLFTCPNCPAFFVCGPVPAGSFQKKFA